MLPLVSPLYFSISYAADAHSLIFFAAASTRCHVMRHGQHVFCHAADAAYCHDYYYGAMPCRYAMIRFATPLLLRVTLLR